MYIRAKIKSVRKQAGSKTENLKLTFSQNNFVMTFVVASFGFKGKQSFHENVSIENKCSY